MAADGGKRRLRSSDVVHELILQSARACFAERGYAGTTTRQIAQRADVVENLLYKHFGNKAGLYDAAVVQPLRSAVDAFRERWASSFDDPHSGERTARAYVEALFELLDGHADLLLAIVTDRREDRSLLSLMEDLERVATAEIAAQGWAARMDVPVLARLHFGMVAFNAAFGDALYPAGDDAPSRERIIDEMTAFMLHGTAHRP